MSGRLLVGCSCGLAGEAPEDDCFGLLTGPER